MAFVPVEGPHLSTATLARLTSQKGGHQVTGATRPGWLLGCVFVVGCSSACGLWVYATESNRQISQNRFDAESSYEHAVLSLSLARVLDLVEDLTHTYQNTATPNNFASLPLQHAIVHARERRPEIAALSWHPVVAHAQRAYFERTLTTSSQPFRFHEHNRQHKPVAAAQRSTYVVMQYVYPDNEPDQRLGFDALSAPQQRAAITSARLDNKVRATAPLGQHAGTSQALAGTAAERLIQVFAPSRDLTSGGMLGYVGATLHIEQMFSALFSHVPNNRFGITLLDPGAAPGNNLIFRSTADQQTNLESRVHELTFGGRRWQISFAPGSTYNSTPITAAAIAGAALLATALLLLLLHNVMRRNRQLARAIDERSSAQAALTESQDKLRLTIDSIYSGGWELNFNTNKLALSHNFCRSLGYAPGDLSDDMSVLEKVVHPDDLAQLQQSWRDHALSPSGIFSADYRALHKHGGNRYYRSRGRIVSWNDDGSPATMLGLNEDITQARLELQRHADLEARLQDGQKLESLGLLAGGIAHDFNNLLVGVLSTAELACASCNESDLKKLLYQIVESAQRASELTKEMLMYADNSEVQLVALDAGKTVLEMRALLQSLMMSSVVSRRFQVQIRGADDTYIVQSDATQLCQIVINLVTNAADAMSTKGDIIEVVLERVLRNQVPVLPPEAPHAEGYLRLRVIDTGHGMSEATKRQAMQPFFSTKAAGRGLGLASVADIVKRHGGTLAIDSAPARGTTVSVYLPLLEQAATVVDVQLDATDLLPAQTPATILVVDDETVVRDVSRQVLRQLGHQVYLAESGEQALQKLQHHGDVELVLMDASMAGMSGLDTLTRIRQQGITTPVVLMSGYFSEQLEDNEGFAELSGFVHKPFTGHTLAHAVQQALAAQSADASHVPD